MIALSTGALTPGIRQRHPDYSEEDARRELAKMLYTSE
jgi:hypothetical protein